MKLAEVSARISGSYEKSIQFLNEYKIRGCTVNPDGVIHKQGEVDIIYFRGETLPVQFGRVSGNFVANRSNLTSMIGFPREVGGNVYVEYVSSLSSIEGIPLMIGLDLLCKQANFKSLAGIDKMVKQIGRGVDFYQKPTPTHILGLLLISNLSYINIDEGGPIDNIMSKYIGTGDIISAQDELIEAGFKEQAKL
jgi:hypothetical protein